MFYTKLKEKPVIAIVIDFRKAFDTIEWDFLKAALQTFNFGPDIQNLFDIIFNQAVSCVPGVVSYTMDTSRNFSILKEELDKVVLCLASFSS